SESGKQQGSGFSRHASESQHATRDHASRSGTQRDGKRRPPLGNAKSVGGLADHVGNHQQHFFRRSRDRGDHHDAQRYTAGKSREVLLPDHYEGIHGNADHDRGYAVQDIGGEADQVAKAIAPIFSQINARSNAWWEPYYA